MAAHLEVRYNQGPEGHQTVRTGGVAAWKTHTDPDNPGKGRHEMVGYADPIVAAQLIEEAIKDGGFVWIIPEGGLTTGLDGLLFIWGADILEGRICLDGPRLDPPLLRHPGEGPTYRG